MARAEEAASRNIETDARKTIDKGWKRRIGGLLAGVTLLRSIRWGKEIRLIQVAAAASARP